MKIKVRALPASIASTSWIETAITFSEKSRKPPVFLLFFTLLADPTCRPCHTQPHRLLTGSEHRAARGRNSSKQWCVFVCFFALRRLNTSVRTAGLYSARRRVLSRIMSMLFVTIPHFRIFDTKVTLSFMDYFIKKRLPKNIFSCFEGKKTGRQNNDELCRQLTGCYRVRFFTHIRKKPEKQPTERRYYCIEILKIGNFVVYLMGIIVPIWARGAERLKIIGALNCCCLYYVHFDGAFWIGVLIWRRYHFLGMRPFCSWMRI